MPSAPQGSPPSAAPALMGRVPGDAPRRFWPHLGGPEWPHLQHELLQVIAHVARRYNPRSLPGDTREHRRLVRGRFVAGISRPGREARRVMDKLLGGMVLPLPLSLTSFGVLRHCAPRLWLHGVHHLFMVYFGLGVHTHCTQHPKIRQRALHCNTIYAWVFWVLLGYCCTEHGAAAAAAPSTHALTRCTVDSGQCEQISSREPLPSKTHQLNSTAWGRRGGGGGFGLVCLRLSRSAT